MVITSSRVIGGASKIRVKLHDRARHRATLRGTDPDLDLALLMLEEPISDALPLSDTSNLRPGDWVAILANSFGHETSVTAGVVRFSAASTLQPPPHRPSRRFIGVDATIDAANWGGPVVDAGGRLVGLAAAAPNAGSRVGLVVPAAQLRRSVDQLAQYGRPARTWIGLWVRPLDQAQAQVLGITPPRGLLVTGVAPGGPAQEAGVEPRDVILEFSGQPVDTAADLGALAAQVAPDQSITLLVLRDGRNRTLRLRPAPMPQ